MVGNSAFIHFINVSWLPAMCQHSSSHRDTVEDETDKTLVLMSLHCSAQEIP